MAINILPSFQDGDAYLECILKKGGHEFESLDDREQISRNIMSIRVVCLDCGHEDFVYQYTEDSEIGY